MIVTSHVSREGPGCPWGGRRKGLRWRRRGPKWARIRGEARTDARSFTQQHFSLPEHVASGNVPSTSVRSGGVAERPADDGRRVRAGTARRLRSLWPLVQRLQLPRTVHPRTSEPQDPRLGAPQKDRGDREKDGAGTRRAQRVLERGEAPPAQAAGITRRGSAQVSRQNDSERGRNVIILGLPGVTSLRRGQLNAATHGSGVTALRAGDPARAKAPRQERA